MFYDVTTLYFETDAGDELRESGFSKEGKHSQPQVVLGLLVSKDGYPLSYSVFKGSQYEGRTMLPIVEDFVRRFALEDFLVVADSVLMNRKNVALPESGSHEYIIGARLQRSSVSENYTPNKFRDYALRTPLEFFRRPYLKVSKSMSFS